MALFNSTGEYDQTPASPWPKCHRSKGKCDVSIQQCRCLLKHHTTVSSKATWPGDYWFWIYFCWNTTPLCFWPTEAQESRGVYMIYCPSISHFYCKCFQTIGGIKLQKLPYCSQTSLLNGFMYPNRNVSGLRSPGRSVWMDTICPSWRKTCVACSPCACGSPDVPKWKPTLQASSMNARSLITLTQKSTCAICLV